MTGVIATLLEDSSIFTIITSLITLWLTYSFILYPFFVGPLHRIPGPALYKITRIFALNDQRVEARNGKLDRFHRKYGSVVQIAPNEVSLSSISHLKRIYIKKNLPKSTFYGQFQNFGKTNAFSSLENDAHLKRKKMMTRLYTKSSIFTSKSQIHINDKVNNVVKFVNENLGSKVDCYELFNSLAMDVVTYYEFGSEFTTNLILDMEARKIIKAFRASSSMWFYTTLLPQFWNMAATNQIKSQSTLAREWTKAKFLEAYEDLIKNYDENVDQVSVIKHLYDLGLHKFSIASELFDHVAAGHETTGTSLAYCTWELSRPWNSHIQDKIHDEMSQNFGSNHLDHLNLEDIDKLEYLNAVIMETTRLHSAIPGSEPRLINKSNDYEVELPDGLSIMLPKGTIVSVQPWSVHRDASIFQEPNKFIPERWLKEPEESEEEWNKRFTLMKSALFAFGQGNRMCLGMNIAVIEMKLVIAQLYWRFHSKISSEWCHHIVDDNRDVLMGYSTFRNKSKQDLTDIELMSMADSYTSRPFFDECWLSWEKR